MQVLTKGRYAARLAETAGDLADTLALRQMRFRVGRGQQASDGDSLDAVCQHMLIRDATTGQLLCSYRLMTFPDGRSLSGSYAAQFYDLLPLATLTAPLIELGRFCLHPDRPDPDILRLAWAALTRIVDDAQVAMLFGCSSFDRADPAVHAAALGHLARHHLGPAALRPTVRAEAVALAPWATKAAPGQSAMPPLLRTYLGMGGWVSDHAVIDRDLDTLHVFTGLTIAAIPPHRAAALRALAADVPS